MRRLIVLASIIAFLFVGTAYAIVNQGTLQVAVVGLANNQGVVRIAMFDSAQAYKNARYTGMGAFKKAILPIRNNQAMWTVRRVPFGCYAIKAFHDVNNNGVLETNIIGIPKEGYGFSNNPRTLLGPASFDKARFCMNQKLVRLTINTVNRK